MNLWDKTELKIQEISRGISNTEMYILILREVNGTRKLPILLQKEEAQILSAEMRPFQSQKNTLLQCMRKITSVYGIIIEDMLINDVVKGKYMSQVTCYQNGQMEKIKASAFDGILIALNYRCPIYIRTGLLERQVFPTPSNDSISLPINTLSIELLEEALYRAVECENYELASQLRDEINRRK